MNRLHPEAALSLLCFAACLLMLALVGLTGCKTMSMDIHTPRVCSSPCGATLHAPAGTGCAEYVAAESRAVTALKPVLGDVCGKLKGWRVHVLESEKQLSSSWYFRQSGQGGNTLCTFKAIEVIGSDWGANAYPHELIHAMQCPVERACVAKDKQSVWPLEWRAAEEEARR